MNLEKLKLPMLTPEYPNFEFDYKGHKISIVLGDWPQYDYFGDVRYNLFFGNLSSYFLSANVKKTRIPGKFFKQKVFSETQADLLIRVLQHRMKSIDKQVDSAREHRAAYDATVTEFKGIQS